MVYHVSSAYANGVSDASGEVVERETTSMANHLDGNLSHHIDTWDFGRISVGPGDASSERDFVEQSLSHIDNNYPTSPKENIIIGHHNLNWGYGGGETSIERSLGGRLYGCAVYIGPYIDYWEKQQMSWHEAGHNWGADHRHGHYDLESSDVITNIRPMGSSYTYSDISACDMPYCGSADPPLDFKCPDNGSEYKIDNYSNHMGKPYDENHVMGFSECSLNVMDNFLDS